MLVSTRTNIARPVARVNARLMRPAPECVITIAGHVVARLFVKRESKVLAIVDDHFEALIVDYCPVAHVAVEIGRQVGKVQTHKECICDIHLKLNFNFCLTNLNIDNTVLWYLLHYS